MSDINPLFIIEAEQLLLENKVDDSINLCKQGLIEYPEYVTAWGILIQAYKKKGDIDTAKSTLEKALNDFPDNKFLISLKDEVFIENINNNNSEKNEISSPDEAQKEKIEEKDNTLEVKEKLETEQSQTKKISQNQTDDEINDNLEPENITEFQEMEELIPNNKETQEQAEKNKQETIISDKAQTDISKKEIIENSFESFINNLLYTNDNITVDKLSTQLNTIPGLDEIDFIDENVLTVTRNSFKLFNEVPDFPNIKLNYKENKKTKEIISQIDDDLTKLAVELETAKIPEVEETEKEEDFDIDSSPIVSETMAKIYTLQGAYRQAANAYQELIKQKPEKKEYFTEKLNEILSYL